VLRTRLRPSLLAALPRFAERGLLTLVLIAITTLALSPLRGDLNTPIIALLYLIPVGLSTSLGGLTLGILASLLAFLAFNFFFITPYYTLLVHQTQDLLVLVVFLVVAVTVSQLLGRVQASLAAAEARERETTSLYELSAALTGLRSEADIAQTLAERLIDITRARAVEIVFQSGPGAVARAFLMPSGVAHPNAPPTAVLPLMTARGRFGEIRLWRAGTELLPAEQRLLATFAGQGALALEHALLSQAETQARILEESDRLKTALLSSVSHELRTPLATMKAAITSLHSGQVDWAAPAREDLLAVVDEELDHLNRLVGNLLDMSRIEAGALKPQRAWLSLAEVVGGTLVRMRHASEQHKIVVDISDELPLVPADYVQLEQVFSNLISNSLKYAPAGSTITLAAWLVGGDRVQVQVKNQGPGVPAEHLDHIFDKFYRVTAADRVTGTGLGLSICKGIVEAHGGRIWAENLPGGFAFNFTLPLTWAGAQPPRLPPESEVA
jgi:two-component system, OmpR family, sensor histidine kinase KdpD